MHNDTGPAPHGARRPLRRIAVGAAVIGLVVAGNAAIGLAGGDGRDGSTVPGAPTNTPTPVADENNTRDGAPAPTPDQSRSATVAPLGSPTDNGRGGVDPAAGPNPVPAARAAVAPAEPASYDTDTGLAPAPSADSAARAASVTEALVDQDIPGAATASAPGPDAAVQPVIDQDG